MLFNPANELLFVSAEDKNLTGADGDKEHFWFLVGGTLENGEPFQVAAQWKLMEETMLTDKDVVWGGKLSKVSYI